jgi:hypothetical protein
MEFGEVYLELYALDLGDPIAIFEFVEKYSSLSVRSLMFGDDVWNYYLGFPGLPTWEDTTSFVSERWWTGDDMVETEGEFIFGAFCLRRHDDCVARASGRRRASRGRMADAVLGKRSRAHKSLGESARVADSAVAAEGGPRGRIATRPRCRATPVLSSAQAAGCRRCATSPWR